MFTVPFQQCRQTVLAYGMKKLKCFYTYCISFDQICSSLMIPFLLTACLDRHVFGERLMVHDSFPRRISICSRDVMFAISVHRDTLFSRENSLWQGFPSLCWQSQLKIMNRQRLR